MRRCEPLTLPQQQNIIITVSRARTCFKQLILRHHHHFILGGHYEGIEAREARPGIMVIMTNGGPRDQDPGVCRADH